MKKLLLTILFLLIMCTQANGAYKIFYMNNYSSEIGMVNPSFACNDSILDWSSNDSTGSYIIYNSNTSTTTNYGTITSVYLYPYWRLLGDWEMSFQPIFNGVGSTYSYILYPPIAWREDAVDITSVNAAPSPWSWTDVTTTSAKFGYTGLTSSENFSLARTRIYVYYTPIASTLSWSSPAAGSTQYRTGTGVAISGTAANVNGVNAVQYNIDGGSWVAATGTTSWSATIPHSSLTHGSHTINTRVQDASTDYAWTTTDSRTIIQSNLPSQAN